MCSHKDIKSVKFTTKTGPNYGAFKSVMEKFYKTEISCRYLHQTDFTSRIPGSHKTRNSKGFCEDNLLLQMAEQNSQGGERPTMLTIPAYAPPTSGR